MKQDTVWLKEEKCKNLQTKFGDYDDFDKNKSNNPIIANRQSVYFATRELLKDNNYSILEVGCGPGHFLWALRDVASTINGLDYSKEMLRLCEAQFQSKNIPIELTEGVCWDLPFEDKHFDVTLQCDVCRHVGGCWKSILEMIRVSKKHVVFSGPSFERWGLGGPIEKELERLMFGINLDSWEHYLNNMKESKEISSYFLISRPNKKDRIKRRILVINI